MSKKISYFHDLIEYKQINIDEMLKISLTVQQKKNSEDCTVKIEMPKICKLMKKRSIYEYNYLLK